MKIITLMILFFFGSEALAQGAWEVNRKYTANGTLRGLDAEINSVDENGNTVTLVLSCERILSGLKDSIETNFELRTVDYNFNVENNYVGKNFEALVKFGRIGAGGIEINYSGELTFWDESKFNNVIAPSEDVFITLINDWGYVSKIFDFEINSNEEVIQENLKGNNLNDRYYKGLTEIGYSDFRVIDIWLIDKLKEGNNWLTIFTRDENAKEFSHEWYLDGGVEIANEISSLCPSYL